jgi:hypothetical protein
MKIALSDVTVGTLNKGTETIMCLTREIFYSYLKKCGYCISNSIRQHFISIRKNSIDNLY